MATQPDQNNLTAADNPSLTVIMPAYNEESVIRAAVTEVQEQVLDRVPGAKLLVVNDGSKDATARILDELASADPRLTIIHQKNAGHGASLMQALNQSKSEYIFQIDSDMQIPLICFPELWKLAREADAVFGVRTNRQDPQLRIFLAGLITIILKFIFAVDVADSNAPCKIIKRSIWEEMRTKLGEDKLIAPSIFLSIYAKKHNYKVIEMPVLHRARSTGRGSLNLVSLVKVCFIGLRQVLKYKDKLS